MKKHDICMDFLIEESIYILISLVGGGNLSTPTKFLDEINSHENDTPRLRVNSSPTRFSSLKNAFLQNGR